MSGMPVSQGSLAAGDGHLPHGTNRGSAITPLGALLPVLLAAGTLAPAAPPGHVVAPLRFDRFAVVSDHALASRAGADVLDEGGNAVDAAVATAFALAVVHPSAGNIGGGGFLVARLPDGRATTFDFRETAPGRATREMFLDAQGKYDPKRHHLGPLSVGVPGSVAGLHLAHERLGKLPWSRLLEPAVRLAREGFPVERALADALKSLLPELAQYPASLAQFSRDGLPLRAGDLLRQPDLARTLERIRDRGPAGFYEGETALLLVREMERLGGIITLEDMRSYRAVERPALRGSYRGLGIIAMGPPSSGGVALLGILNVLEGFDLTAAGFRSARESHLLAESLRRAFADRARWLGDPDRVDVPVARLVSKEHAADLRRSIDPARATPSSPERFPWPDEAPHTTHLSVVDGDLLAVALTTTIEDSYGSRIVVPGAGFLLNDEMGDFNPQPGRTDASGLIGTPPNLVEPGKRMLSSMCPVIVERGGQPWLVTGSPGGRTIISTVAEVLVDVIDHDMRIGDAVDAPRFHHGWLPDVVQAEAWCFPPETRAALEAMGHRVETRGYPQGAAQSIAIRLEDDPPLQEAQGRAGSQRFYLEVGVDRRQPAAAAAGR